MISCVAATLYAAKAIQRPSTVGKVRGNFKITWVKMGRGDHKSLYKASRGLKFSDIFDAGVFCRWLVLVDTYSCTCDCTCCTQPANHDLIWCMVLVQH